MVATCLAFCLQGKVWSPSSFIAELGKEINNPQSVYYWAYKVNAEWSPMGAVAKLTVLLEQHTGVLSCNH